MAPTVAPSAAGGSPDMPPVDGRVTARRRVKSWFIAVGTTAGLIVVTLIVVVIVQAIYSFAHSFSTGFGLSGLVQVGASEASLADGVAKANHIPDGTLTPALLNAQHSNVTWLSSGDSAPPTSSGQMYVSISALEEHVVTAVSFGLCQYGLTVATSNDPIIGHNGLPGVGTYFVFSDSSESTNACSADSAPSSGWHLSDKSVLRSWKAPSPTPGRATPATSQVGGLAAAGHRHP